MTPLKGLHLQVEKQCSKASRGRRQRLWPVKDTSRSLAGYVGINQRQHHSDVPGNQKGSFGSKCSLSRILDCKKKPRDPKGHKDLRGGRGKTTDRGGEDARRSRAVTYKHESLPEIPSVCTGFVAGLLGRLDRVGLLVLGI